MSLEKVGEATFVKHPLVYEINTRCWLHDLSASQSETVHLGNVPESEFLFWKELGFTHIWLMGLWRVGPITRSHAHRWCKLFHEAQGSDRKFICGSPYAIQGYEVHDSIGGERGLSHFRSRLHTHGLGLLLDFIPNHVGLDHPWLHRKSNLFVQSRSPQAGTFRQITPRGNRWLAHGRDPYFDPWSDTVQLDYRKSQTHVAMLGELKKIAGKCDGVRCDMAMLVLNEVLEKTWSEFPLNATAKRARSEFWEEAILAIKSKHQDFMFLAEVYWGLEARLQGLGFDYTYDKTFYDHVVARRPQEVQRLLIEGSDDYLQASAHFLENHDEPRIASLLSYREHQAAASLLLALPGLRLLHEGQLTGAIHRVPVQLSCRRSEPAQPEIVYLYTSLLERLKHTAIGKGRCRVLRPMPVQPAHDSNENILLLEWHSRSPGIDLVAVNLGPEARECLVADLPQSWQGWNISDVICLDSRDAGGIEIQGHYLRLKMKPYGVRFLQFAPR